MAKAGITSTYTSGMTEDPEEVHPDHGRAAGLRVEEMSAEVAVDQQHDLRRRQRADGEDNQDRHHEVQPGEQRHLAQRHSRAAHAQDRGQNVDRRADAAECRRPAGQRPEIGAVAGRECLRGQRRVREPSHIRRVARPIQAVALPPS